MLMNQIAELGSLPVLCLSASPRTRSPHAVDDVILPMVKSSDGELTGLEMVQTESYFSDDYVNAKIA